MTCLHACLLHIFLHSSLSNSNIREFKYGTFNNGKISILYVIKLFHQCVPLYVEGWYMYAQSNSCKNTYILHGMKIPLVNKSESVDYTEGIE